VRSVGWAWLLQVKIALWQGPLDGLLVAWKGIVSEQRHFCKPDRTVAENLRAKVSRIVRGSIVSGHFAEASSAKAGCGNVLTRALGSVEFDRSHCWRVLKHLDVTCGAFAEASSADWSAKEGRWNVLTGDSSFRC
jgi:hypothetical protein